MTKGIRIVVPPEKLAAAISKHFAKGIIDKTKNDAKKVEPTAGVAAGHK